MKTRPIIFSGDSVRAIIDGRKTETRRVVKLRDPSGTYSAFGEYGDGGWPEDMDEFGVFHRAPCPYGVPGDRLWARETWGVVGREVYHTLDGPEFDEVMIQGPVSEVPREAIVYRAEDYADDVAGGEGHQHWRSPIHMPRWASRLTLSIVSVYVQRLQDIDDDGARREGFADVDDLRDAWQALHTKPGTTWDDNPWVWVIRFEKVEDNHHTHTEDT